MISKSDRILSAEQVQKLAYTNQELARSHERLREELDASRKALQHYANEDHWSEEPGDVYTTWGYNGGHALPWKIAREALEAEGEQTK